MNTNTFNLLNTQLLKINFSLSPEQLAQFATYTSELLSYNAHTNLISREIKTEEDLLNRHILDSLSLLEFWDKLPLAKPKSLADIGSGGGFPGLCLAIARPELEVVLIDSVGKKTEFLKSVVKTLKLENRVQVELGRIEEIAHERDFRETFDIVTSRAVSAMPTVSELGLPLLEKDGCLVSYKSKNGLTEEIESAQALIGQLGGGKASIHVPTLGNEEKNHCLVFIAKIKQTPTTFPRVWSKIKGKK
ncbi:16S rRNA (guanine(527)-N(7))-methyltransferase RsmG [bacterium]|nr:16S rRNA (guanine(527)-N(7))-methyltransferase RsmG [bacterium]QQR56411.1 MAG: 16S rRNA (guanine(527)-N(7))-methyltransferase RsmG [Candidatus Melainabacteria bacterium]